VSRERPLLSTGVASGEQRKHHPHLRMKVPEKKANPGGGQRSGSSQLKSHANHTLFGY
jgi:hypothetical protein